VQGVGDSNRGDDPLDRLGSLEREGFGFLETSERGDLDSGIFLMEDHQMDRNVIWGNREASVATLG
jgi:hypothetical protein